MITYSINAHPVIALNLETTFMQHYAFSTIGVMVCNTGRESQKISQLLTYVIILNKAIQYAQIAPKTSILYQ